VTACCPPLHHDVPAVHEARWRPDDQLIPAILAGSPTVMRNLAPADRAWVIAGLRRAGLTAEAISDRLSCSLRQVRAIAAEPLTAVCRLLQEESETFAAELRMTREELRARGGELRAAESAANRYKLQLFRLLDATLTEPPPTFPCGCPRTRYNTYIAPKTGKVGCREHRRLAVARHRERRALSTVHALS
jgi:hypothetical protein